MAFWVNWLYSRIVSSRLLVTDPVITDALLIQYANTAFIKV